ncbi:hypothetical protein Trco_007268 [Trichoderma cornu-damae]|uniref:Uncharacterized protein n=1 Tax=Trichoderma cornu-damae TaxID=654480 RepID=A0A9P8QK63_9HYPO|nr:hypothetical protein Trco_007268 [Trichoderma cornu-damae]
MTRIPIMLLAVFGKTKYPACGARFASKMVTICAFVEKISAGYKSVTLGAELVVARSQAILTIATQGKDSEEADQAIANMRRTASLYLTAFWMNGNLYELFEVQCSHAAEISKAAKKVKKMRERENKKQKPGDKETGTTQGAKTDSGKDVVDKAADRDTDRGADKGEGADKSADKSADKGADKGAKGKEAKGEAAKGEAAKGEAAKGEAAKGEAAKGEAAKGEEAKEKRLPPESSQFAIHTAHIYILREILKQHNEALAVLALNGQLLLKLVDGKLEEQEGPLFPNFVILKAKS